MTEADGTGHNSGTRQEIVSNSLEEYYQLDKKIAALSEKHLATLREKKSAIVKRLRTDCQMPAKVFKGRYGMYRLERQAQELDDVPTMEALKEMAAMVPFSSTLDVLAGGGETDDFEEDDGPTGKATFDHNPDLEGREPEGTA